MFTRFLLFGVLLCTVSAHSATLVPFNATWRFQRGTNEASLPDTTAWRGTNFNDADFANAAAPFWYGDVRPGGTQLTDMFNNYTCIFLRRSFVVSNAAEVGALRLEYFIDDGFLAWINGVEIWREGLGAGEVTRLTLAANQPIDPAPLVSANLFPVSGYLREGTNWLTVQVFNTSTNSSDIGFDCFLATVVSETNPPTILSFSPPAGVLTVLTQVTVNFSEPVIGVTADDFLINTQPANSVSGAGASYTFTFTQPEYGAVSITWFPVHGITDEALPPNSFDAAAPAASWMYTLMDTVAPTVAELFPPAGVVVRTLSQIEVRFSEEVTGVDAADLLINGQAATSVTRPPGGPYVFQFQTPTVGPVQVQWAETHGITDQAESPNAFAGGSWNYTYDPNASIGDLVINEIVASNQSGLLDEDNQEQDWIEIHNRGTTTVNLANWSLSDDPEIPGLWTFPARSLGPGEYLVIFASAKDRKPASGPNRPHTNFQLGSGGEHLGLYTPESPRALASGYTPYPEQRNDTAYGYDTGGQLRYFATPTPGAPNGVSSIVGVCEPVHFSVQRGLFNAPFNLVLSTPTPGGLIRYTTNNTEPTLTASLIYSQPILVSNTALIRAAAFKNNFLPSTVRTHTYFFNLTAAQRALPVVSIVTPVSNFVGRTGILGMGGGTRAADQLFITNNPATDYHNPSAHGLAWERPVSAEYIRQEDNSGFQIDCGIRVQGSDWQRPRTLPTSKFSFRLYFRGDYGDGRLDYPLYPLTTVESFDQVVLRAGFNDNSNPFIRDELARRISHDMGQIASHGSFVNVFTNGGYAGYYNPCERVHESFMQSYAGGGADWDVIAPSFAQSSEGLGIVDGDRNDFNNLMTNVWGTSLRPVTSQGAYLTLASRLDLANFTDYCLLNAYAAMGDWPANNWRAARERGNPGALWRFIIWDAEWANGFSGKTSTYDTFAQTGTGTTDAGLNSTSNSEIARLYQGLRANAEFRLLWADRIHKHFFNGGALATLSVSNRMQEMRNELQGLFTITDTTFLNWPRDRISPLFGQFNTYGLYGFSNVLYGVFASSNAPAFNQHGGRVAPGFALSMAAPLGGAIYFTTNGHDPRVPFSGAVSNAATAYAGPVALQQPVLIKARTLLNGTNWSALAEAVFDVGRRGVPLRIAEIMYNPLGGSPYEFLELQNAGNTAIDLGGMYFDGIVFTFLEGSMLAPGARLVLGSDQDPNGFNARYPGLTVFGRFGGSLNNGGERLTLFDTSDNIILSVDFDDENGWPTAADGSGRSLEILDPLGDPDDPANWRASAAINGTPGAAPAAPPAPAVVLNEIMAENLSAVNNGGTFPDWIELHNPGGSEVNLAGWSLTDDGNARQFVFPALTTLAAGGHLVVWCDAATNTTPGLHTGFALGRNGESVFLYNPATNLVDALTFGLQLSNLSVGRVSGEWVLTQPTTNAANVAVPLAAQTNLVINEWLANPLPGQDDWLELYNRAAQPVSLQGVYLGTTNAQYQLTALSFIAAQGWAQIFADEGVGPDHVDFRLPASGGNITLYDVTGAELQRVLYGVQTSGVSQGRLPDGNTNAVNFPGSVSPAAMNYTNNYVGVIVNEVLARNQSVTNAGRVADYVELFNPTASPVDIAGMSLRINSPEGDRLQFPPSVVLAPNTYLLVWCDDTRPFSTNGGFYNVGETLDGESGGVYLFNTNGQVVNSVSYGFQVPNLSIGVSNGVWRLLAAPTPGATNSGPAVLGTNTVVRLNEWLANPVSGENDWFELFNPTNRPVDLGGMYLSDDPSSTGRTNFRVAPLSFIPAAGWVRFVADGDASAGLDHVNFSLDAEGEALVLHGTSGTNLIDLVSFGRQSLGVSSGRLPDAAATLAAFPGSATPAESNYQLIDGVVVNELLTHTDSPLEDAIELRNAGISTVNLGGWYLSDSRSQGRKFRIPDNTLLAPGGFAVFYEYQFNDGTTNAFNLSSARGGEVWLSAANAGILTGQRAGAQFGAAQNGVSFGRVVTSMGVDHAPLIQRTFGMDSPGTLAQFRSGAGGANSGPRVGPVILNEIHYNPAAGDPGSVEFIELLNTSGSAVPLHDPAFPTNRWRLRDGVYFDFPGGISLGAGAYALVVGFDPVADPATLTAFRTFYNVDPMVPVFGPYLGRLGNDGDAVELQRPDAPQQSPPDAGFVPYLLADRVNYTDAPVWPSGDVDGNGLSLQRRGPALYGNEPVNWLASAPTPGGLNGSGVAPPPVITQGPQGGTVLTDATVMIEVTATGGDPLAYQWRFNGNQLAGATNAALVIGFIQLEDTGSYDVVVSNPGGSAVSTGAALVVLAPPQIITPPVSQVATNGTNVTFTVAAAGTAPLSYQWSFNGVPIPGATSTTLLRTNVGLADTGEYSVRVTNVVGSVTTNASLLVMVRPVITVHPLPVVVAQGGTAVFSVSATGTLPLGYRWRRNGALAASFILYQNTSFFVLTNVQPTTLTNITVVVTNAALTVGVISAPSSGVALTIIADTDGDGLPDAWEDMNGFNSGDPADAALDPDNDGMTNLEEYIAGTNHQDDQSYLRVDRITPVNGATLTFQAVAGRTYTVQFTEDVAGGIWSNLANVVAQALTRTVEINDPGPFPAPRIYRLATPGGP